MRLYPNLVKAVVEALEKIFVQGAYADLVVEQTLKIDSKWGARDRKFIAKTIYDIVRWYRLYEACLGKELQFFERFYAIFAVSHILKGYELPPWEEFKSINILQIKQAYEQYATTRKIRASIPDWLDELGILEFGETGWTTEINSLNEEADVYLRANTLKTSVTNLINALTIEKIEVKPLEDQLFKNLQNKPLKLLQRQRLQHLLAYKNGLFEIQDAASQLVAPFLQVKPGMFVIDACAGAGGKTLHVASLMENKGSILAMDVELNKLQELERRAHRAGVEIIRTKVVDSAAISKNIGRADRLLLDVPCSGLGVLKRNPDAKWKLSNEFIAEIQKTQAKILSDYSMMLKQGGLMVYATCSILPSENQNQIRKFLNNSGNAFELQDEKVILPSQGYDGFYMACLKKMAN
jgi:16S rRNA (cytosine967-C5)-methyltransferase